jgi:hypothetical protein
MTRPILEQSPKHKERRPFIISAKGWVALLICFMIGVAAAVLLIYTMV